MLMKQLFVALAASMLLAGGAVAQQSQQWPSFEEVDQDGDGVINQQEAQQVPGLQEEMQTDQMTRQEYEQIREQKQQGGGSSWPESGESESMP